MTRPNHGKIAALLARQRRLIIRGIASGLARRRNPETTSLRRNRIVRGIASGLAASMLGLAALACDVQPPAWTPSPPQLTAIILNVTAQAGATLTAGANQGTPEPSPTPTPTPIP